MLVDKGSVLIHCRNKYCDFPGKLFQYPQDFTTEQIYRLRAMILQTTEAIEDLRQNHETRQVVICTREHLVLGITAYIKDILGGEENYADCGGRPVYGFFGFVWKEKIGGNGGYPPRIAKGFPSVESFALLTRKYVLPKWEVRYWEECQGAAYGEQVEFDRFPEISGKPPRNARGLICETTVDGLSVNTERTKLKVYPGCLKNVMLQRTLQAAVRGGGSVTEHPENRADGGGCRLSCCTGFPSLNSAGRSAFMNVTCAGRAEGRVLLKRRKVKRART